MPTFKHIRNKYAAVKSRALRGGIDFDLTFDWYKTNYLKGCALTGVPFHYRRHDPGNTGHQTGLEAFYRCSVDRINPDMGYLIGNCHLILHGLNVAKQREPLDIFKHRVRKLMSDLLSNALKIDPT